MATVHRSAPPASRATPTRQGASPGTASIVAGIALALMAILGGWANFGALTPLVAAGDAVRTVDNIAAAEPLFRAGVGAMVGVAVLDVIVAIALFAVFEPVNRGVAAASAAFRVAYAAGLIAALGQLALVPMLLDTPDEAMRALEAYNATWQTSLILFAVHLLMIGYLGLRSGFMPRVFGVLLILAGLGYLADGIGFIVVPDFSPTFALFTFIGEVALIFWLLISGRRLSDPTTKGTSDVV